VGIFKLRIGRLVGKELQNYGTFDPHSFAVVVLSSTFALSFGQAYLLMNVSLRAYSNPQFIFSKSRLES
jgi:hypothetical protein